MASDIAAATCYKDLLFHSTMIDRKEQMGMQFLIRNIGSNDLINAEYYFACSLAVYECGNCKKVL